MVDKAKRKTLKNVAGIGVGTFAATAVPGAIAGIVATQTPSHASSALDVNGELASINLSSRLSSTNNELEVVITNSSAAQTTITAMTPSEINTVRGRFNFNELFENGNVTLAAGESVTVPMQHHAVALDSSDLYTRSMDLTAALQQNVSFITEGDSLAVVSVSNQATFA